MPLIDLFLAEFDQEMANLRKMLERVPEAKFAWKPHEKSFTMLNLASHVANIPTWTIQTFQQDQLDIAPAGQPPYKTPQAESAKHLLELADANIAAAKKALSTGITDEQMMKPWTLLSGGKAILTLPRWVVQRSFVMNHMIHHRAQLGLYLRLCDVSVPGMYGPSADETGM